MWSMFKALINKILGRTDTEEPVKVEPTVTINPVAPSTIKTKELIKPKEPVKTQTKILEENISSEKLPETPKEKILEPATIKSPKEIKEPKKRAIKPQEKLPIESSFEIKEANITVVKPVKTPPIKPQPDKTQLDKPTQPSIDKLSSSKDNLSWKAQADAAEKIKRAFQGFFYDVASLESINEPSLKKNNFENYKITFKTKLDQNLSKLELLDQQILQHISTSLLNKDIKDITETLEKQTMEQVSKVPDKYIN